MSKNLLFILSFFLAVSTFAQTKKTTVKKSAVKKTTTVKKAVSETQKSKNAIKKPVINATQENSSEKKTNQIGRAHV